MRYHNLEDYIATLSESDKEQYKSLIDESRQRSIAIKKNCNVFRESLEGLFESLNEYIEAFRALGASQRELETNIFRVHFKYAESILLFEQCEGEYLQHYPKSLN